MRRWLFFVIGCGLLMPVLLSGCDGKSGATTISGKVSVRGTALDHGLINFFQENKVVAGSSIAAEGSYSCELAAGDYIVTVNCPVQAPEGWKDGDPPPTGRSPVPARYLLPKTSNLSVTVGDADAETHDFDLK